MRMLSTERHVVQLGDGMGTTRGANVAVAWVCGAHDPGRGELPDGNVVRVAVATIRAPGQDDLGPHATDVCDQLADDLVWLRLVQFTIEVVQNDDLAQTECRARGVQLGFTDPAECLGSRIGCWLAEPAPRPPRSRDPGRFHALG